MDNFNIYLSKNISDSPNYQETNYKTTLAAKNVNLNDYEVALSSISFQNTLDLDLGSVTLISGIAKDVISTFDHKIKTKYGTDFIELFKDIEREIVKGYSKLEFKRRVLLRQSGVIDRGEYIYREKDDKGVEKPVFLPFENQNFVDILVKEQILASAPKIYVVREFQSTNRELNETTILLHNMNSSVHTLKYSGNICLLIPELDNKRFKSFDYDSSMAQIIKLPSNFVPSVSLLFLESDLIESYPYGNTSKQILKFFETKPSNERQLIDFGANLEYCRVKKRKDDEQKSINISILDENYTQLSFIKSSIKIKLNFRKLKNNVSLFK